MTARGRARLLFWVWCAVILTLTSVPTTAWNGPETLSFDKLAHAILYAVFAALYLRMRRTDGAAGSAVRELLLLMLLVPALDEAHQLLIPGRQCSAWDMLADIAGMSIILLAHTLRRKRHKEPQTS